MMNMDGNPKLQRLLKLVDTPVFERWLESLEVKARREEYKRRAELVKQRDEAAAAGREHEARRIDKQLFTSADPAIDAFAAEMRQLGNEFRRKYDNERRVRRDVVGHRWDGSSVEKISTNEPILNRRLEAVASALRRADELKREAVEDLALELESLRSEIAAFDVRKLEELEPTR